MKYVCSDLKLNGEAFRMSPPIGGVPVNLTSVVSPNDLFSIEWWSVQSLESLLAIRNQIARGSVLHWRCWSLTYDESVCVLVVIRAANFLGLEKLDYFAIWYFGYDQNFNFFLWIYFLFCYFYIFILIKMLFLFFVTDFDLWSNEKWFYLALLTIALISSPSLLSNIVSQLLKWNEWKSEYINFNQLVNRGIVFRRGRWRLGAGARRIHYNVCLSVCP